MCTYSTCHTTKCSLNAHTMLSVVPLDPGRLSDATQTVWLCWTILKLCQCWMAHAVKPPGHYWAGGQKNGFKYTHGFMLNRSRTATPTLPSRLRLRSVRSLSLVQVMWTRSGPVSALSFMEAWDAVFLSWMSWAWKEGVRRMSPGATSLLRGGQTNGEKYGTV